MFGACAEAARSDVLQACECCIFCDVFLLCEYVNVNSDDVDMLFGESDFVLKKTMNNMNRTMKSQCGSLGSLLKIQLSCSLWKCFWMRRVGRTLLRTHSSSRTWWRASRSFIESCRKLKSNWNDAVGKLVFANFSVTFP